MENNILAIICFELRRCLGNDDDSDMLPTKDLIQQQPTQWFLAYTYT